MTLTLIVSKSPRGLGEAVILRALGRTGGPVLAVDAGNSIDPYALARAGGAGVLRRVVVSRAFTAFQLDELVRRELLPALAAHGTSHAVVLRPLVPLAELPPRDAARVLDTTIRGLVDAGRRATVECVEGAEALTSKLAGVATVEEFPWDELSALSRSSSPARPSDGRSSGGRCGPRTSGPSTRC